MSTEKISQWEKNLEENAERKSALEEELNNLKEQMMRVEGRVAELKKELGSQNQLTLKLNDQLENAYRLEKQLDEEAVQIDKSISEAKERHETCHERQRNNLNNLREVRENLEVVIADLLKALKTEKSKWQSIEIENEENKKELVEAILALESEISRFPDMTAEAIIADIRKHFSSQRWIAKIEKLAKAGQGLHAILFERGGIHSQKEELDEKIVEIEKENEALEKEKISLQENIAMLREKQTGLVKKKEGLLGDIKSFNVQKSNLKEKEETLKEQAEYENNQLKFFANSYKKTDTEYVSLDKEKKNMENFISQLKSGIRKELQQIEAIRKRLSRLDEKKEQHHKQVKNEKEKLNQLFESTNDLEVKIGTYLGSKETLLQDLYNDYNMTYDEVKEQMGRLRIQVENEKSKLYSIKKNIEKLGPINMMAIEQLKNIEEMYNHNFTQKQDIENATAKIIEVIDDIHKKSEELFLTSFNKIQDNFRQIFQRLFRGGDVSLNLQDPSKPLESGIEIQVQPPGKRARSLRLLSGGEKALTAIALMFGTYKVRSSPFCVLDEIDAPLDDANVDRFLTILTDFSENSQFILITHNKKTMSRANAIFGVTMDEPGVSRIISVELKSA